MLHAFRLSAYYFRNEGRLVITRIESKHNTTLRHLARLAREKKYRQGAGEMVCEGEKMLYEALSSGVMVKSILLRTGDTQNGELIARAEARVRGFLKQSRRFSRLPAM